MLKQKFLLTFNPMGLNHPFDFQSDEEMYFYWYLRELEEYGYTQSYKYQPKPFPLFSPMRYEWTEQLKTKQKQRKSTLLKAHEYQADFLIFWTQKAHLIFHTCIGDGIKIETPFVSNGSLNGRYYSVIDVKGTYDQQDNIRRFSISQKWVWEKHEIFVQKIVPVPQVDKNGKCVPAGALFPTSFTPRRYNLTNKSMARRKINFHKRLLTAFVVSREIRI